MESLNHQIKVYRTQLKKGEIQKAYKGIMTFMSGLSSYLEKKHTDFVSSGLYFGYMDMTYFAFTPSELKNKKLKIAIVYLHVEGRFEAWLGGANRKIQADYINKLKNMNLTHYKLSTVMPGVDSIIETILVEDPDFDHPDELMIQIEHKTIEFAQDIVTILAG